GDALLVRIPSAHSLPQSLLPLSFRGDPVCARSSVGSYAGVAVWNGTRSPSPRRFWYVYSLWRSLFVARRSFRLPQCPSRNYVNCQTASSSFSFSSDWVRNLVGAALPCRNYRQNPRLCGRVWFSLR